MTPLRIALCITLHFFCYLFFFFFCLLTCRQAEGQQQSEDQSTHHLRRHRPGDFSSSLKCKSGEVRIKRVLFRTLSVPHALCSTPASCGHARAAQLPRANDLLNLPLTVILSIFLLFFASQLKSAVQITSPRIFFLIKSAKH